MVNIGRSGRLASGALVRTGLLCGLALLIAACGLQKSPQAGATASGGRTAGTSAGASHSACVPADLKVVLDLHAVGVAAGTSYLPVDFTNVSTVPCRLNGFPVVTLTSGKGGHQIGTAAIANHSTTSASLLLRARQTAHIWLRVTNVANLPASSCNPVTAAGLRITLPGTASPIFLGYPITACAKPVHGADALIVDPFQAGKAQRGTAQ